MSSVGPLKYPKDDARGFKYAKVATKGLVCFRVIFFLIQYTYPLPPRPPPTEMKRGELRACSFWCRFEEIIQDGPKQQEVHLLFMRVFNVIYLIKMLNIFA